MKWKRNMTSVRDRLSELPDCVILHIMNFMNAKHAVQTSILSKRFEDLWKRLNTLSFLLSDFKTIASFNNFVYQVLSRRNDSISLFNLGFWGSLQVESQLLIMAMKYALSHSLQHLTIQMPFDFPNKPICFDPLIFSCPSLTSLNICKLSSGPPLELPKSLQLPALKSLSLMNVSFSASDNGCAEPFSICNLLDTLVLRKCFLHNDAQGLFISNSNLSTLKLVDAFFLFKIALSTPNLSSLTILNYLGFNYLPLLSTCNLSCLEEGTIHTTTSSSFIDWLQVFGNAKTLTLSYGTLKMILKDISNLATIRPQFPCFLRLESLKVRLNEISNEKVNTIVNYLLQNSPLSSVAVINCC